MKVKGWHEDEMMVCKGDVLLCESYGKLCEDDMMVGLSLEFFRFVILEIFMKN